MFGLSTLKLITIGIAVSMIIGGFFAWKTSVYNNGREFERMIWEKEIAAQKLKATTILAVETAKVRATEARLQDLTNTVERNHVEATAAISAAGDKYNRLGKLYEQAKRCGRGGSGSVSEDTTPSTVTDGGEGSRADVSGTSDGVLAEIARDADILRAAVVGFQAWARTVPEACR